MIQRAYDPFSLEWWIAIGLSMLGFILLLTLINALPVRGKRWVFVVTAFLAGLFYTFTFYLPGESNTLFGWNQGANWFSQREPQMAQWISVILAFTLALGLINLGMVHGRNIVRRRKEWVYSLFFFAALLGMLFFGIVESYLPEGAAAQPWSLGMSGQVIHRGYSVMFDGLFVPLNSTMFSILAFFIASAAFRAFRMRSGEATLMLFAAFVMMLGQVPLGIMLTNWIPPDGPLGILRVEQLANWLLTYPSMAAIRAIAFGIAVGAVAMALRVWLSLERGAFFEIPTGKD